MVLNAEVSILANKSRNPGVIITKENQLLSTSDNQPIYLLNLSKTKFFVLIIKV
ncbi:MAG: hypothetical protein LZF60_380158 [Nitrospira sp.]|nr:MAG: hypothetical protein LZF60_380158 [Nitrospira sp.]